MKLAKRIKLLQELMWLLAEIQKNIVKYSSVSTLSLDLKVAGSCSRQFIMEGRSWFFQRREYCTYTCYDAGKKHNQCDI